MRQSLLIFALLLAVGLVPVAAVARGAAILTTWSIPTHNSLPEGIAVAGDGTVFFAEFVGGRIGELNPRTNMITERLVFGAPYGLALVRDLHLYWTDSVTDRIGELALNANTAMTQSLPSSRGLARAITHGINPNGLEAVWYLERDANRLAALTIAGARTSWNRQPVTEYMIEATRTDIEIPSLGFTVLRPKTTWLYSDPATSVRAIYEVDPLRSGGFHVWDLPAVQGGRPSDLVIDASRRTIVSTEAQALVAYGLHTGEFVVYPLPAGTSTHGLTCDAMNRIWYTDKSASRISRVNLDTGELVEYQLPSIGWPHDLVLIAQEQLVVFTEWAGNSIGVLDLRTSELTRYALPIATSHPVGIAADSTHMLAVYFTAEQGNYIGRLELPVR